MTGTGSPSEHWSRKVRSVNLAAGNKPGPGSDSRIAAIHRWWQTLPEDFYSHPDATEADAKHPFKVRSTAVLDRMLRTGLGTAIALAMSPSLVTRERARTELDRLGFYADLADRGDVDAVFSPAPRDVEVRSRYGSRYEWQPRGFAVRQLSFETPYVPLHPDLRSDWAAHQRNRVVQAQHWLHPEGPRPTLVFVHGYIMDSHFANSWGFSLPWLYKMGYDILMPTLPFHGSRREKGQPFSGFGFLSGGLAHMNESMLQAIQELRVWLDYLFNQGAPQVGISGLSLGGYLSAIMATVDPRLAFCIPNSPVIAPVDMAMEWQPIRPLLKVAMRRDRVSVRELRHGMALHSPLSYPPRIDPRRILIIGGAGDRVTPPRFMHLLHQHWTGSGLRWFPGNHIVHLHQAKYLRLMQRFMDRQLRRTA